MTSSRAPLSERQVAVLRWICDGCPDGVMSGHTHKTTALALQGRRLVVVTKRCGQWQAEPTDAGRHYLAHGRYPDPPAKAPTRRRTATRTPSTVAAATRPDRPQPAAESRPAAPVAQRRLSPTENLVAEVLAADGRLIVQRNHGGPGHVDYEHLVLQAQRHGKVPAGKRLTTRTMAWPDMEIRLEDAIPGSEPELRPVPVPETVARYHPVVVRFRDQTDRHEVSRDVLPRALRVLQGLVVEAERRGYRVEHVSSGSSHGYVRWTGPRDGHIRIAVDGHETALRIHELGLPNRSHWERTHYASRERYPTSGSGALSIEICGYASNSRSSRWADRTRWTLDDKLPELLREIEVQAAEAEHRKREAERAADERRRRWENAVADATTALVEEHRAKQLLDQAQRWNQAGLLGEYVTAMRARTAGLTDPSEAKAADEWITWTEAYIERSDPLTKPLSMPASPKATPEALQPFLKGWSAYGPDGYPGRF